MNASQRSVARKTVASVLVVGFGANIPLGIVPLELLGNGSSPATVAQALATAAALSLVTASCAGIVIDWFGAKVVSRATTTAIAVTSAVLAATHTALDATCALAAASAALTLFRSATMTAAVLDGSPTRRTSNATTVGMVANITFALGPLAGTLLEARGFGRPAFVASAALCLATLLLHESGSPMRSASERAPRVPLRLRWMPSLLYIFALGLQPGVNTTLAVVAFHAQGLNGSLVVATVAIVATLLRYPAGRFIDHSELAPWCASTVVLNGVGCLALAHAHTLVAMLGASFVIGLAWSAIPPISIAALLRRSDDCNRGSAIAAYGFASSLGAAAGSALATVLQRSDSAYSNGLLISAILPIVFAIPLWLASAPSRSVEALKQDPREYLRCRAATTSSEASPAPEQRVYRRTK